MGLHERRVVGVRTDFDGTKVLFVYPHKNEPVGHLDNTLKAVYKRMSLRRWLHRQSCDLCGSIWAPAYSFKMQCARPRGVATCVYTICCNSVVLKVRARGSKIKVMYFRFTDKCWL